MLKMPTQFASQLTQMRLAHRKAGKSDGRLLVRTGLDQHLVRSGLPICADEVADYSLVFQHAHHTLAGSPSSEPQC
jgi:hypothetical protein